MNKRMRRNPYLFRIQHFFLLNNFLFVKFWRELSMIVTFGRCGVCESLVLCGFVPLGQRSFYLIKTRLQNRDPITKSRPDHKIETRLQNRDPITKSRPDYKIEARFKTCGTISLKNRKTRGFYIESFFIGCLWTGFPETVRDPLRVDKLLRLIRIFADLACSCVSVELTS